MTATSSVLATITSAVRARRGDHARWWDPPELPDGGLPDCPVCGAVANNQYSSSGRYKGASLCHRPWCGSAVDLIIEAEARLAAYRAFETAKRRASRWT